MERWKGTKCEPGYIHKQKIFQSLMLLMFAAIGVGLFLTGLLITKTRANVFTVLGILMVLPAAKRVITLVVMLPRHSVEQERYDKLKAALSPGAVLLTDYVFTSADKIMSLDFVLIQDKHVIGIRSDEKGKDSPAARKNMDYMTDYLKKGVMGIAPDYQVKIVETDEEFYPLYAKMSGVVPHSGSGEDADETEADVVKYLKILAV